MALELFLSLNDCALLADDADCVLMFVRLTAEEVSEEELAAWVREYLDCK